MCSKWEIIVKKRNISSGMCRYVERLLRHLFFTLPILLLYYIITTRHNEFMMLNCITIFTLFCSIEWLFERYQLHVQPYVKRINCWYFKYKQNCTCMNFTHYYSMDGWCSCVISCSLLFGPLALSQFSRYPWTLVVD